MPADGTCDHKNEGINNKISSLFVSGANERSRFRHNVKNFSKFHMSVPPVTNETRNICGSLCDKNSVYPLSSARTSHVDWSKTCTNSWLKIPNFNLVKKLRFLSGFKSTKNGS